MSEGRLVSPQDIFNAAKDIMLEGRDPVTTEDWIQVVNFMAYNIATGLEESACLLLKSIFDIPLSKENIILICTFVQAKKIIKENKNVRDQKVEWKQASQLPAL